MSSLYKVFNLIITMIFAYAVLIGFLIGVGLQISENHKKFIRHPIVQILGGFSVVQKTTGSPFATIVVLFLFYASTLLIANDRKVYKDLLGQTLGEFMIDLAEDFNILN